MTADKIKKFELRIENICFSFFFIYCFFGIFGFGNDVDTYLMLRAGQDLILNFEYYPSRFQGALIPEIIIGALSIIGNYYLSNFFSALLGSLTLYYFYKILKNNDYIKNKKDIFFIIFFIGFNPHYIIASSSSHDYIYSLFLIIFGFYKLNKENIFYPAILFALSLSSRIGNALIPFLIYINGFLIERRNKLKLIKLISGAFVSFSLFSLLFVPALLTSGKGFNIFSFAIGDWSYLQYLARFIYKNISLIGILNIIIFAYTIVYNFNKAFTFFSTHSFIFSIILSVELVFLRAPLEIPYLLPLLFTLYPCLLNLIKHKFLLKIILLTNVIFHSFIFYIDFLNIKHDSTGSEAISSKFGFFIKKGLVIKDIFNRNHSYEKYKHIFEK